MFSSHQSHASSRPPHPAAQRLIQKQREYQSFLNILAQNRQLVEYMNAMGDRLDTLDAGSEVSLAAQQIPTSAEDPTPTLPNGAMPDRIVRIPVEDGAAEEE
ncbi:DASH complex, subunit Dad2 [Pseudohyphozyma bogoriensis]|nr:DASH complex, subunit Dad2 [Pseudohyphozyma bogoriensis]